MKNEKKKGTSPIPLFTHRIGIDERNGHSTDKLCAEAICSALELQAIGCWIAPRNISPGQEWASAITDAISRARVMVLVFSSSANNSPHIMREVALAVDSGVVMIPFRIEHTVYSRSLAYYLSLPKSLYSM